MSNQRPTKIARLNRAERNEGSIRHYKLDGYRIGTTKPTVAARKAKRNKKKASR